MDCGGESALHKDAQSQNLEDFKYVAVKSCFGIRIESTASVSLSAKEKIPQVVPRNSSGNNLLLEVWGQNVDCTVFLLDNSPAKHELSVQIAFLVEKTHNLEKQNSACFFKKPLR